MFAYLDMLEFIHNSRLFFQRTRGYYQVFTIINKAACSRVPSLSATAIISVGEAVSTFKTLKVSLVGC